MATRRTPHSGLRVVPPPTPPTEQEKQEEFIRFVDEQDTRTRKEILLITMRVADEAYRRNGRAGYRGDIRKLREDMAALEHELATVTSIEPSPRGKR